MSSLPADIWALVFMYIDVKGQKTLSLTSKFLNELVKPKLWNCPVLTRTILHYDFARLGHLPIKKLNLEHINDVTDHWLWTISMNWKNLLSLNLTKCNITDEGLAHIASLDQLRCLILPNGKEVSKKGLFMLVHLPIEDLTINEMNGEALSAIGKMTTLKKLDIRKNNIQDREMSQLANLTNLQLLNISDNSISELGLTNITHLRLKELYIRRPIYITYTSILRVISQFRSLKKLYLGRSEVTDECMDYIGHLFQLQSLFLDKAKSVTATGLSSIAELPLLELVLSGCTLTDNHLQVVGTMVQLINLDISGSDCSRISDNGLEHLGHLSKLQRLYMECHLGLDKVTEVGFNHLLKLPLKEFGVKLSTGMFSTDYEVVDLLLVIGEMTGLQKLDISKSGVLFTDIDLPCFNMLTELKCLNMNKCDRITPNGLVPLIHLPLEALFISKANSYSNDQLIELLAVLPCMPKLKVIRFDPNYIFSRRNVGLPFSRIECSSGNISQHVPPSYVESSKLDFSQYFESYLSQKGGALWCGIRLRK